MMIIAVARALLPAAFDLDLGSWQNPAGSNPKDAPVSRYFFLLGSSSALT
jgi:hypothetical protein